MKDKSVVLGLTFIVICILIVLYINHKDRESLNKTEIIEADYYSLFVKYEYVYGSRKGSEFREQIKVALNDGVITHSEYEKLTGQKARLYVYTEPEMKEKINKSKDKLVLAVM